MLKSILLERGKVPDPSIGKALEKIVKQSPRKATTEGPLTSRVATSSSKLWKESIANVKYSKRATDKWVEAEGEDDLEAVKEIFPKTAQILADTTAEAQQTAPRRRNVQRSADSKRMTKNEESVRLVSDDIMSRLEIKFDRSACEKLADEVKRQRDLQNAKFLRDITERLRTLLPKDPSPLGSEGSDEEPSSLSDDDDGHNDWQYPVIGDTEEDEINEVLSRRDTNAVVVEAFNIPLLVKDIQTLSPSRWLNDEVINFYLKLIVERSEQDGSLPKVYAFSTFFYPKLQQGGHDAVKRWTRKVDIFDYDILLIPVHLIAHWALVSVHTGERQIRYYDSLNTENTRCLELILRYLMSEHLCRKEKPLNWYAWRKMNVSCCQQMNADDCGVFACQFAEALSRRVPIYFNQGNMPFLRRKMVLEIKRRRMLTIASTAPNPLVC